MAEFVSSTTKTMKSLPVVAQHLWIVGTELGRLPMAKYIVQLHKQYCKRRRSFRASWLDYGKV